MPALGALDHLRTHGYLEDLTVDEQTHVETYIQGIRLHIGKHHRRTRTQFYLTTYERIVRVEDMNLRSIANEHALLLPLDGYCNWKYMDTAWLETPAIKDVVAALLP